MNICMVAYTFYDGDNRVMRYAEALAARGDHVDVIALKQPGDDAFHIELNGVNIYRVQSRAYDERGLASYAFRITSFFLKASWLLFQRHQHLNYEVVHVHSVPDPLVFAALFPKLAGAKIILDIHDLLPELYSSKFSTSNATVLQRALIFVERVSAAFADHVIVANDLWRDKIIGRKSVKASKCTTILNFPDPKIFSMNGISRSDGKFRIMYPGTLSWHQGLDVAIRAFASVTHLVPEAEFHIYGDGSAKPALIELRDDLGLGDKVFFHKCMSLRSIAKIMASANLAVVPKRADSFGNEAFSTKTFEFMSLGVPLILADTTIDKHYFDDSVVRFFRSGNHEDLAASMLDLITHPTTRQQLAENALQFVQRYTWDAHKADYLNLVDCLAARCYEPPKVSTSDGSSSLHSSAADPQGTCRSIVEYFGCPEEYASFDKTDGLSTDAGYSRVGTDLICYDRSGSGFRRKGLDGKLRQASASTPSNGKVGVCFDPEEFVDNLRLERYATRFRPDISRRGLSGLGQSAYYAARPFLPLWARTRLQRIHLNGWHKQTFPHWPTDTTVDDFLTDLFSFQVVRDGKRVPFIWFWPEGAAACAILTHDVESPAGYEYSSTLMDIDERFGFRSSFQLVPKERYAVSAAKLTEMAKRGFEVNVHDFNHDGRLFWNRSIFDSRAVEIRRYATEVGAKGFRSAVMYRNPDWMPLLGFEYDMSIPNVARLDPQAGGCCTVMPYFIGDLLELPLTTTQDYFLFNILKNRSMDLWREQVELITRKHGMASFLVHPDYILRQPERDVYLRLLSFLQHLRDEANLWTPRPQDVNDWWRARAAMRLVRREDHWTIQGPQAARARVAFAVMQGGKLSYELD
jgi:glycosyltransferase involved in cell wall biosynthesis